MRAPVYLKAVRNVEEISKAQLFDTYNRQINLFEWVYSQIQKKIRHHRNV